MIYLIFPWCRINASVKWVSIGSCIALSPVRCQAITWTHAGLLSIGLLGTNFSEIRILSFSFKKMHLKLSSAKMAAILSRGRYVSTWVSMWCDKVANLSTMSVWYLDVFFWFKQPIVSSAWPSTESCVATCLRLERVFLQISPFRIDTSSCQYVSLPSARKDEKVIGTYLDSSIWYYFGHPFLTFCNRSTSYEVSPLPIRFSEETELI